MKYRDHQCIENQDTEKYILDITLKWVDLLAERNIWDGK